MSALPPKADIRRHTRDVRFVPKLSRRSEISVLFDHLIGQRGQLIRHTKAEGLGGLEVEVELEFCRLLQLKSSA